MVSEPLPTIHEEASVPDAFVAIVREWLAVLESTDIAAIAAASPPMWPPLQEFVALPGEIREHWCALVVYVTRHAAARRQECAGHVRAFLDWLRLHHS